jgi:hypothetical protein
MFIIERLSASAVLRTVRLTLVPVLVLIAGPGRMAAAGQGGVGIVDAVAGPSVPAGTPIAVVAEEFSDLNTQLQEVVERALTQRGFTVKQDAPMILSFDVEMSNATADIQDRAGGNIVGSGEPGATGSPYQVDPAGEPGANESPDQPGPWQGGRGDPGQQDPAVGEPQVTIPFGRAGGGDAGAIRSLSFTLGRDGRPPIWEGTVTATLPGSNPYDAARAMVPVLVDYIGRTARGEQVTID